MPSIDVDAIFKPATPLDVDAVSLFAGRRELLRAALQRLAKPKCCLALFGERGVGKTSLGRIIISLLEGRVTPHDLQLKSQRAPRRICVQAAWQRSMASAEHLCYRLFHPNDSAFAMRFPKIVKKYQSTFDQIKLEEVIAEAGASHGQAKPNQALVHKMVRTIEKSLLADNTQANDHDSPNLVVVLDDMDFASGQGKAIGLGEFFEQVGFQFILIGRGDGLKDFLDDPSTPVDRFRDGQFLVEPLTRREVREFFDRAAEQAKRQGAKLRFSREFCDLVAEDFVGNPALIQSFGMEVVLNYQKRLAAGIGLEVRSDDYLDLLRLRETSPSRDLRSMNDVSAGVNGSPACWEALQTIAHLGRHENGRWVEIAELHRLVDQSRLREYVLTLRRHDVLQTDDSRQPTRVRVAAPAVLCEINRRIRLGWNPARPQ